MGKLDITITQEYTTPLGVAKFPHINAPDTKFSREGEAGRFSVKLLFEGDTADEVTSTLEEFKLKAEENYKRVHGREKKISYMPLSEDVDKEYKPTGKLALTLSAKADKTPSIIIYNKYGDRSDREIKFGSELSAFITLFSYDVAGKFGIGARLRAVKVESYSSGATEDISFEDAFGTPAEKQEEDSLSELESPF